MNVLVVGGGCSVSNDIINRFTDSGHHVITTVHNNGGDSRVVKIPLDLQSVDSIDIAVGSIAKFKPLDVVVFAVGIQPGVSLEEYSDEQIDTVLTVNFSGQVKLLKRLLPYIADGGRIVFISSVSADSGGYDPVYCASKSAVNGFVKSIAKWLSPRFTTVAVSPGLIKDSTMYYTVKEHRRQHHEANTPTKMLTTKEQLASIVYDISQAHWNNVNGQVIIVSGGLHV